MDTNLTQRTVGEIAAEVPAAIGIFEKLGIDYCCGGTRPLTDACRMAGVSVEELCDALSATGPAPEAGLDWNTRPLSDLHAYLVARFHVSARAELDTMSLLAAKVATVHGERHPEVFRVAALVDMLQADMLPHMMKEEAVLFPYVTGLETDDEPPASCFGTVGNPIRVMLMEHEAVGALLGELRTVTGGFVPPADACFSYGELYRRLAAFEKETHEHIHLENNIYFPRALQLEQRVTA